MISSSRNARITTDQREGERETKATYNVQREDGFDTYLFLDSEGGWTSDPSQACQYGSWDSANKQSMKFSSAYIMQSETSSEVISIEEEGTKLMASKKNVQVVENPQVEEAKVTEPTKSDQIRTLYVEGMSKGDIGRKLGVRYQMVRAVILRMEEKASAA